MNYKNINTYLYDKFPEFREKISQIEEFWYPDEIPSHVLYGDVLNKFLFDLLKENKNTELIKRVFSFYEDLANCPDTRVQNLLQITLLEYLWDDFAVLSQAHKYMNFKTRELSNELQIYFRPFVDFDNKG